MREFRPPRLRARARIILGIVLLVLVMLPVVFGLSVITGTSQIRYTIAGRQLTVFTGGLWDRQRTVPLSQARSVRMATLRGGRRVLGTAFPGYCVGRFRYEEIGAVWQATTCRPPALLLTFSGGQPPWLLSPPDPLDFMARLSSAEPTVVELPPADKSSFVIFVGVMLIFGLLTLGMIEAVVFLGPSRICYRVGRGTLEVRTLFGRRRWPIDRFAARLHSPRVTLRVAGIAMPGYYTGYFRADGKSTRIYATQLTEGVLLEGPARVYLSPQDPAAFLAELRAGGCAVSTP